MMMPSIFGENLFDDWMDFPFDDDFDKYFFGKKNPLYGKHAKNMMKTDVKETDDTYEVDIDLPGFKKDEINAKLENGYLTISAAKGLDKDEKDKKGKYIRKERYAGAMSRSFYVGEGVTQDEIKAKYEDGILKLTVPKKDAKAVEKNDYIAIAGKFAGGVCPRKRNGRSVKGSRLFICLIYHSIATKNNSDMRACGRSFHPIFLCRLSGWIR